MLTGAEQSNPTLASYTSSPLDSSLVSWRSSLSSGHGSFPPIVTMSPDTSVSPHDLEPLHDLHGEGLCDCDWKRYLAAELGSITRAEHDELLVAFFKYSATWGIRVIESRFLADMRSTLTQPAGDMQLCMPHYSAPLHNIILAAALAFAEPGSRFRTHEIRNALVHAAINGASNNCWHPVAVVQSLAAIANYYNQAGQGYKDSARHYLLQAVTNAHSCKLPIYPLTRRQTHSLSTVDLCQSQAEVSFNDLRDNSWCFYTVMIQVHNCYSTVMDESLMFIRICSLRLRRAVPL